jgi:ABC-type antimicrobial peptide transport system permease subunit
MNSFRIFLYVSVGALAGFKFIPGAAAGILLQFSMGEQLVVTIVGGILGTAFFTYFGGAIRKLSTHMRLARERRRERRGKPPKVQPLEAPSKRKQWINRVWQRFGLIGCAFLTPTILSIPIGTGIAVAFGSPRFKVLVYNSISIVIWAFILAFLGNSLVGFLAQHGVIDPDGLVNWARGIATSLSD